MQRPSLRVRFLALATFFLSLVLGISGFGLIALFERAVTNLVDKELMANLDQLISSVEIDEAGQISIKSPFSDLRYREPYGGRYWQISKPDGKVIRSRSLWDTEITLPKAPHAGEGPKEFKLPGPNGQRLLVLATAIVFSGDETTELSSQNGGANGTEYILITATNLEDVIKVREELTNYVLLAALVLALLLLLSTLAIVGFGLRPLDNLRDYVARVVSGKEARIRGNLPKELDPIVDELNTLLQAQEDALQVARNRASDLAHGLKTPLAILTVQSRSLRKQGLASKADEIDQQVKDMQKHVKRELARVRARGRPATQSEAMPVAQAITSLVKVMKRLPHGDALDWQILVGDDTTVFIDKMDFHEIAGNLLDNARKWARSKIAVSYEQNETSLTFTVEDDGPGIREDQLKRIIKRGEKLNPKMEGSGVGLSIVHDLVALYDGSLDLMPSSLGGLKVEVTLSLSSRRTRR